MDALFFFIGAIVGFLIGRMKKKQRYGSVFTYNQVYKFCGGNPTKFKGIVNGKNPAVFISSESGYSDCIMNNMIYYCGTFHKKVSPANPGHQDPSYYMNKFIDTTKKPINIFIKRRDNEYVHIGMGKRVGIRRSKIQDGRRVMIYPIVFMTGDLEKKLIEFGFEGPRSPNSPCSPRV